MLLALRPVGLFQRGVRLEEHPGEVEPLGLPVVDHLPLVEALGASDQLGQGANAHGRHDLAHLFRHEEEEVDDVLGRALEARAKDRVLRRHAHRTGVEMALAHHDAAGRDQRARREAELVGAEQRADHDVAARPQAAVDLKRDARAKPVEHQRLLGLGKAHLPRGAGVLDGGERRGARATVIARHDDVVGARLGDARRDRADADLGDELHRDVGFRVDVLQVVDELRQILDRVDVVVRRGRDQADARRRVPGLGDGRVHLVAGQLAALAGLGTLRHLDLEHVGVDEILGRHAEASRRHLLDGRALGVLRAVGQLQVAVRLLAALARVRLAADAVHRDGERRMGLARDRAEAHRARRETLDDLGRRLDLVERHRGEADLLRHAQLEQAADGGVGDGRLVHERGVLLVGVIESRRTACWSVATASGDQIWASPRMR